MQCSLAMIPLARPKWSQWQHQFLCKWRLVVWVIATFNSTDRKFPSTREKLDQRLKLRPSMDMLGGWLHSENFKALPVLSTTRTKLQLITNM